MRCLLAAAVFLVSSPVFADSLWDHNGSTVVLHASGVARQFVYQVPRASLSVTPGTVLFKGQRQGYRYSGTAYLFSSRCGPIGYSVSGPVAQNERKVTLHGNAPSRNTNCKVVGHHKDTLVFSLLDNAQATPAPSRDPVLICLRPVFEERERLISTLGRYRRADATRDSSGRSI